MEVNGSLAHPHPHPMSNPYHRKIELQSALDLAYLQHNIAASVRQKLDLHFPPSASQPQPPPSSSAEGRSLSALHPGATDPMRQRVEELVTDFLDQMWTAAKANVVVNGQDVTVVADAAVGAAEPEEREGVDFEYELYDSRLSAKVAGLYAELEGLTTQVARLRRTAPIEAAKRYGEALREVLEEDVRKVESEVEAVEKRGLELQEMRDGWEDDVAAVYERGVAELRRLGGQGGGAASGSLTETVGKVQRAKEVAQEIA